MKRHNIFSFAIFTSFIVYHLWQGRHDCHKGGGKAERNVHDGVEASDFVQLSPLAITLFILYLAHV